MLVEEDAKIVGSSFDSIVTASVTVQLREWFFREPNSETRSSWKIRARNSTYLGEFYISQNFHWRRVWVEKSEFEILRVRVQRFQVLSAFSLTSFRKRRKRGWNVSTFAGLLLARHTSLAEYFQCHVRFFAHFPNDSACRSRVTLIRREVYLVIERKCYLRSLNTSVRMLEATLSILMVFIAFSSIRRRNS